jgi:DeoR/GlpR family transcriptional regulator of sugar metabolism
MLIPDRRRRVLAEVRRHGSASIEQLAAALAVSSSTIRRDMSELEQAGMLRRTHGGAVVTSSDPDDPPPRAPGGNGWAERDDTAKARIARRAASMVEDGSTVMLLGGSTTGAMVPALFDRQLTVVTNGLEIAHGLRHAPLISVVVVGGYLHREQMSLLGPMTLAAMSAVHVDVMMAGAWGVDPDTGVTGNKISQAGDHDPMLRHTDRLVVLADATKIGRRGPTLFAGMDRVHTLVTDRGAAADVLARIEGHGVRIDTV